MFLPGAIYVIAPIIGVIFIVICAYMSFAVAAFSKFAIDSFIDSLKPRKRRWFDASTLSAAAMILSFLIFIYAACGPYIHIINWLRSM